jgi:2'-5' RNA ligase
MLKTRVILYFLISTFIIPVSFAEEAVKPKLKDLAVLIYVPSEKIGNEIYEKYIKDFGFPRKPKAKNADADYEYHVTLGYIDKVEPEDIEEVKSYVQKAMQEKIYKTTFNFGAASLLGRNKLFFVAMPANADNFIYYNNYLADLLKKYKDGKYKLDKMTQEDNYIPHLTLNGKVGENVPADNIAKALSHINKTFENVRIPLSRVVVN